MKVRDIAPYGVRMPAELKEKLQEVAKKNGRSLNSEIVKILEDYVSAPDIKPTTPPTVDQLQSPEKMQEWVNEIVEKIQIIEKEVLKNYPQK